MPNSAKAKKLLKTLLLLGAAGISASCSEKKQLPDPVGIAKSNFSRMFSLPQGLSVPLSDSTCDTNVFKAKTGVGYVECRAQVKGYVHYEVRFCPTKVGMECESARPE